MIPLVWFAAAGGSSMRFCRSWSQFSSNAAVHRRTSIVFNCFFITSRYGFHIPRQKELGFNVWSTGIIFYDRAKAFRSTASFGYPKRVLRICQNGHGIVTCSGPMIGSSNEAAMKTLIQKMLVALAMIGLVQSAGAQFTFTTNNGAITITKYTGSSSIVIIPGTTNGWPVVNIGTNAFQYSSVGSVTIPNSVTSISPRAFYHCYSLANVAIPDSVTNIGDYAFEDCFLTNLTIGSGVISIGNYAFDYCFSLRSVTIPNSVVTIGVSAFFNCAKLTSITIPNSVTTIGHTVFSQCTSLTNVIIGTGVTNIGPLAFGSCSSLAAITVDTQNSVYSSVDGVFFDKNQITLIEFPSRKIGGYIIPNSVTSIANNAFEYCSNLTSVTIPDKVTTIGTFAFSDCVRLSDITIGNGLTSIGDFAFANCAKLTSVTIPSSVTSLGQWVFSDCTNLTSISLGSGLNNIGYYAFSQCYSLPGIVIPNNVTNIASGMFNGCSNLTYVTIPTGVTSIGNSAFWGCKRLTSIIIPNSVVSMGSYVFKECSSLVDVTLPDNLSNIENDAFLNCRSLMSVILPNSVTNIGNYAFQGCYDLTNINIPNGVVSIGESAFYGCNLNSVSIPNSVTNIGLGAFVNCYSLTALYFQGNASDLTAPISIFYGDTNVTCFYLPETTGWGATFCGFPAVMWNPQATTFNLANDHFDFDITGPTNAVIVVEACTNLVNPVWLPVSTNMLTGGTSSFSDWQSLNHPRRFYRFRSP